MTSSDTTAENFFDVAYRNAAPWDVGEAQPAILALFDRYPPEGPVLDVGCGTGDLSLALARRGVSTLGIDRAELAITKARGKAAAADPRVASLVEFRVGDALHPGAFEGPFGAVVDSGFFHQFGPEDRRAFVNELAALLTPGGRYYLLGFAISSPMPNAPREVRDEELRSLFSPERGWRVLAVEPARFATRSARGPVPAITACIERES